MNRFDGTAARQLVLLDDGDAPLAWREEPPARPRARNLRLLQKDIYAELTRRRRRAQIAARRWIDEGVK
jgi:hypothetical protein